jgi:hypothetical protein
MAGMLESGRAFMETADSNALQKQEEAVEVASQWAQEKIENFMLELE